jgi:hypothetical protein
MQVTYGNTGNLLLFESAFYARPFVCSVPCSVCRRSHNAWRTDRKDFFFFLYVQLFSEQTRHVCVIHFAPSICRNFVSVSGFFSSFFLLSLFFVTSFVASHVCN